MKLPLLLAFAMFATTAAVAQEPFSMLGTWKGQANAVHLGANPYRATDGAGPNMPANAIEFTFVINEQQGNRFSGTSTSGTRSETIIGAIAPDNAGGVMLDDDGQYLMTIKTSNSVDVCYNHRTEAGRVVACYPLNRAQ